ncbi:uncharacterized protein V1516DRAFT_664331 [Lipomyces oligophaga]|uniref:uncharacterized protein n=1 Tax=Lipomyces oligophaga TaxID=45792 RepID=UPI0034CD73C2
MDYSQEGEFPLTVSSTTLSGRSPDLIAVSFPSSPPPPAADQKSSLISKTHDGYILRQGSSLEYQGSVKPTDQLDCFLVYDDQTNSFTLHHPAGIIEFNKSATISDPPRSLKQIYESPSHDDSEPDSEGEIETSSQANVSPSISSIENISVRQGGPISLRGYAGSGRIEDDISSSSEEE